MNDIRAEVVENSKAGMYKLMRLKAPSIASSAQPGQFVMLQVSKTSYPLLRRPFGIHGLWHENKVAGKLSGISILYQVIGQGTDIMSKMTPGEEISLLGPLGNGFSITKRKKAFLLAGGIGIAPLLFLANRLSLHDCEITLLAGAQNSDKLYTTGIPENINVILATEDGSKGTHGFITEELEALLDKNNTDCIIYASGPRGMLKRASELAQRYKVDCQLSMETAMACGIGVCYGCVVKSIGEDEKETYVRICKDGPVFESSKIVSFESDS